MMSVISSSPLFDGWTCFANSITLLSKKYSPVTAKFERGLAGFYSMETTL